MASEDTPVPGRAEDSDSDQARAEAAERRRRAGRGGSEPASAVQEAATPGSGVARFVRECWAELKRVQWPGRAHLWQATAVVMVAVALVGTYLYALDSLFKPLAAWLTRRQAG